MAIGDKIQASTFNEWYTRLNAVRSTHGLSTLSYTAATAGSKMLSSQMSTLSTNISSTRTETHLASSTAWTPGTAINAGNKILNSTKTAIELTLTSMESICHYYADYSNYSNYSNYNHNSDRSVTNNPGQYVGLGCS